MIAVRALIKRNITLFFKDKGVFFTSLITPVILLVLYVSFLGNVYRDTYTGVLSELGISASDELLGALVSGQLVSSLLAVCCVTVAFCSNMLMVADKASGARGDLTVSPVKPHTMALSYYIASFISTLIICLAATALGLVYISTQGWYLSASDVILIIADVLLLVMFGVALSSIVNFFLSTQGQISAVGTIVSSGYGFICGAYMPISQFSETLQTVISFLPGTYGTVLLKRHALRGAFEAFEKLDIPAQIVDELRDAVDYNLYFFDTKVSAPAMYAVLGGTVATLIAVYIAMNIAGSRRKAK